MSPNNDQEAGSHREWQLASYVESAAPLGTSEARGLGGLYAPADDEGDRSSMPMPTLGMFLRYKWTIILIFALIAIPANALIWTQLHPVYQAKATVQVSPIIPRLVFKTEDSGMIPLYQNYMNTQVSLLQTPKLLERVLDREDVKQTRWYRDFPADPTVEDLLETLSVRAKNKTELIEIVVTARKAADAEVMANAVLDQYDRFTVEERVKSDTEVRDQLEKEFTKISTRIDDFESDLSRLRSKLGTTEPDLVLSQNKAYLDDLERQMQKAEDELAEVTWQQEDVTRRMQAANQAEQDGDDDTATVNDELAFDYDAEWRTLNKQLRDAEYAVEVARQDYGESHPKMRTALLGVDHARALLKERERQLIANPGSPTADGAVGGVAIVDQFASRVGLLTKRKEALKNRLDDQRSKFAAALHDTEELMETKSQLSHQKDLYEAVRMRMTQKEMEGKVQGTIRTFPAYEPVTPARDRRTVLSLLSIFGGLAAGLALAYVRAGTSQAIYEIDDVGGAARAPVLGALPILREAAGMAEIDASGAQSESIRMVRTALLNRIERNEGRVFAITSSGPGEGKTTLAVLLARSLARCGKRVLLVDADLRHARLDRVFGIPVAPGLSGLLGGRAKDETAISADVAKNLHVIPAGDCAGMDDFELLANGAFTAGLKRWRDQFDVVLIDSPPVLPVADACILARQTDGTILVVREKRSRRTEVIAAVTSLGAAGARIIGTVFFGSPTRNGRYRYGYGYGYGYKSTEVSESMNVRS
jgi:capsular exopolysaccharide synthesis family protein